MSSFVPPFFVCACPGGGGGNNRGDGVPLTMALLEAMRQEAFDRKSVPGVRRMIKAFRCGCHLGESPAQRDIVPALYKHVFACCSSRGKYSSCLARPEPSLLFEKLFVCYGSS